MTVFNPTKDALLDEEAPTIKYGSTVTVSWGNRWSGKDNFWKRPLMTFDMSGTITFQEYVIRTAKFTIEVTTVTGSPSAATSAELHTDDDDWSEANATWNQKDDGPTAWSDPGNHIQGVPYGESHELPGDTGPYEFEGINVAAWGHKNNGGIVSHVGLYGGGVDSSNLIVFDSKDATREGAVIPKLTVTHEARGRQVCSM